jgi:hypothetical protein
MLGKDLAQASSITATPSAELEPNGDGCSLQTARVREAREEFANQSGVRAGIEGTISQGVRAFGLRRARYFGQAKTRLQHILTAAAINLVRLAEWFAGDIPSTTRTPPLVAVLNMVPLN